jgi:hypothetical protein
LARAQSSTRDDFITSSEPFDGSPVMDESVRTEHLHDAASQPSETYVRDFSSSVEEFENEQIADEVTFVTEGLGKVSEGFYPDRSESATSRPTEETLFESVTVQKDHPEEQSGDASILLRDVTERVSLPKAKDRRTLVESLSASSDEGAGQTHRGPTVEHRVGDSDATIAFQETRTRSVSPGDRARSPKTRKVKYQSVHSETVPSTSFSTKSEAVYRQKIPPNERVGSPTEEFLEERVVRSTTPTREGEKTVIFLHSNCC